MRGAATIVLALSASVLIQGPASAQRASGSAPPLVAPAPPLVPSATPVAPAPMSTGATAAPARAAAPAAAKPPAAQASAARCDNPNALGVSRTVEIDTTGGPGFGFEHFKQHDFLRDKE